MHLKTPNNQYDIVEFSLLVTPNGRECTSVLELLIDYPFEEFDDSEFEQKSFTFSSCHLSHIFSDFEVNEFYEEGDFIRVILVK